MRKSDRRLLKFVAALILSALVATITTGISTTTSISSDKASKLSRNRDEGISSCLAIDPACGVFPEDGNYLYTRGFPVSKQKIIKTHSFSNKTPEEIEVQKVNNYAWQMNFLLYSLIFFAVVALCELIKRKYKT